MNKKISIPIVPVLIIILVAIIIGIILIKNTQDKTSKLSKIYDQISEKQEYKFTRHNLEEKNKEIVYKKNSKTMIDTYDLGEHTSTLIKGGNTYLISHENKEYYVYPSSVADENALEDKIKDIIQEEYTTGKEKIYGVSYKYEEYNKTSSFLFSWEENIDTDTMKTRFYFKGNELVYLKTIYNVIDKDNNTTEQKEELQTIKIEQQVENSVFEIPSDYAEN